MYFPSFRLEVLKTGVINERKHAVFPLVWLRIFNLKNTTLESNFGAVEPQSVRNVTIAVGDVFFEKM